MKEILVNSKNKPKKIVSFVEDTDFPFNCVILFFSLFQSTQQDYDKEE